MELKDGDERMMRLLYLTCRACNDFAVSLTNHVLQSKHNTDWEKWTNDSCRKNGLIQEFFNKFEKSVTDKLIPDIEECDTTLLTNLLSRRLAKVKRLNT